MTTRTNYIIDNQPSIEVIDLFCGIGGLSYGLKVAGCDILGGYDLDSTCEYAYRTNTGGNFTHIDIKEVKGSDIIPLYSNKSIKVLAGCAPCQPFSSYSFKNKNKDKDKYDLLYEFGRLVEETLPDIVTMENVPSIGSFKLKPVLKDFISKLNTLGYRVSTQIVYCPDYGIPQTRKRLVLLASRLGEISLISPTHKKGNYVTVRETIGHLEPLESGGVSAKDPLHKCRSLSTLNLLRVKSTPSGGSWKDWDESLMLNCHKKNSGKSFGSVYGRMLWDKPSPTITTQCTGLGNGRFGHPDQDRAISAREAALLQTFPQEYVFFENESNVSISLASRYIGNAVPPKLGEIIGESIIQHLKLSKNG